MIKYQIYTVIDRMREYAYMCSVALDLSICALISLCVLYYLSCSPFLSLPLPLSLSRSLSFSLQLVMQSNSVKQLHGSMTKSRNIELRQVLALPLQTDEILQNPISFELKSTCMSYCQDERVGKYIFTSYMAHTSTHRGTHTSHRPAEPCLV